MPIEDLLHKAQEQGKPQPATVITRRDAADPVTLGYGRDAVVYVDAYSGDILGEGSAKARAFFQTVTSLHRWLGIEGNGRASARTITDACNFAFLFLILSGAYLWIPRRWSWQSVRAVSWFRAGVPGKARDFNWHNTTGLWCVLPLLVVVASGVVMSYPWANNLVYQLAGSKVPEQNGGGRRPDQGGRDQGNRESRQTSFNGFNEAWAKAESQMQGWQSISLRMPNSNRAPLAFTIDRSNGGRPQERGTLTVDRATGEILAWETYASQEPGRQWRTWLRFAHTGEYYGIIGQTVAGIASLGGALLVWTGLSLALRRLRSWRGRDRSRTAEPIVERAA